MNLKNGGSKQPPYGYGELSYRAEQIKKPLENYRDIDSFKIYLSDLGLLSAN